MFSTANIRLLLALVIAPSLYAMDDPHKNACTAFEPSTHQILPFDGERDKEELTDLFNEERERLVRRPEFNVNGMLFRNSVYYEDEKTHGSLVINVLRAPDAQGKMTLRAFAAYTRSADKKSVGGNFLAVKKEDRRKNYAQYLLCHGIDQARSEGATELWLSTRKEYSDAQALYRKVAAQYPQYDLSQEEATTRFPNNPRAAEAIVLVLKLKQQ